jgi:hypothetical protein
VNLKSAVMLCLLSAPCYAGPKADAQAHLAAAKAALAAGDVAGASKAVRKAKSVLRAKQRVLDAIRAMDEVLGSCADDADCTAAVTRSAAPTDTVPLKK